MMPEQRSTLRGFFCLMGLLAIVALATMFILTAVALPAQGSMTECIDATCRITSPDGGCGTGCVFEIGQGNVYILTAAHVVEGGHSAQCEFWRAGHQSTRLPGQVIAQSKNADAAIVAVRLEYFAGMVPAAIPIAPRDYVITPGATLTSVGCANGTWATGWKGHSLGYEGGDLRFLPVPANGRSGSAVFDGEGKMIVAVLRARTGENSEGIATPVQGLYDVFGIQSKSSKSQWREGPDATLTQCPGGQCPIQPQQPQYRLLPYRQQQDYRQAPQGQGGASPAWPTLPSAQAAPVDLSLTNQKLDRIAEMLGTLIQAPSPPIQPPAEHIDDKARKQADEAARAAAEAKAAATEAGNNIKVLGEQTLGTVNEVKKIGGLIEKFGGDPETLIQKALDRVSKVQANLGPNAEPDDVLKGYLKDLAKEKIKEGLAGGLSFDKLVSVGGGIPAVGLAIFGCVIVWKLVNNKPLAIEQFAPNSLAGQAAAQVREHVASAIEPIKNQIDAKLSQITGVATEAKAAAEAAKAVSQVVSNLGTAAK